MNRRQMIQAIGVGFPTLALASREGVRADDLDSCKGLTASRGSAARLRRLPTTARPVVDPADVAVPEGYELEPLIVGLSFATCMEFEDDGTSSAREHLAAPIPDLPAKPQLAAPSALDPEPVEEAARRIFRKSGVAK